MLLGEFKKLLALCGYPQSGGGAGAAQYKLIAQSAVPVVATGTLNETALATITIPGGTIGPNGRLRVWFTTVATVNTNDKYIAARFGSADVGGYIGIANSPNQRFDCDVVNQNSQSVQYTSNENFLTGIGFNQIASTGAVDTSVDQMLVISGSLANIADSITLTAYSVEVMNP